MIRIDLVMLIAREVVARFVVETFAEHVHEDHVLPVSDSQARGSRLREDGTPGIHVRFTHLRIDSRSCLAWSVPNRFHSKNSPDPTATRRSPSTPTRRSRPDRTRASRESAVFLGQPGIEHPAEIHVARHASRRDDDRLARANVQRGAVVAHLDAKHPARVRLSR